MLLQQGDFLYRLQLFLHADHSLDVFGLKVSLDGEARLKGCNPKGWVALSAKYCSVVSTLRTTLRPIMFLAF